MAELTNVQTVSLKQSVRHEVDQYAGNTHDASLHAVLDDQSSTYLVVSVPEKAADRPAWVTVMAKIVRDRVVILEDTAMDKPLVDALMHNAGIPRERIILAYAGETLPEELADSPEQSGEPDSETE